MNIKYYFDGKKIVEVEYGYYIDHSDQRSEYDYYDRTRVYKNMKTGEKYYINKGIQHYSIEIEKDEIFNSEKELIEFKIKEYEEIISSYNEKIKLLKNENNKK